MVQHQEQQQVLLLLLLYLLHYLLVLVVLYVFIWRRRRTTTTVSWNNSNCFLHADYDIDDKTTNIKDGDNIMRFISDSIIVTSKTNGGENNDYNTQGSETTMETTSRKD